MSSKEDILFVEDNPFDVELTLRTLQQCGMADRVIVARDGAEALDYLMGAGPFQGRPVEEKPRLILLDLKLPKVTGLQVLQWIRADPRLQDIPVIILTTFVDDRAVVELFHLGVIGYLVKPLDATGFSKLARKVGIEVTCADSAPAHRPVH